MQQYSGKTGVAVKFFAGLVLGSLAVWQTALRRNLG